MNSRPSHFILGKRNTGEKHVLRKYNLPLQEANNAKCPKTGNVCKGKCESSKEENESGCKNEQEDADPIEEEVEFTDGEIQWYRPLTLVVRSALVLGDVNNYAINDSRKQI